MNITGPWKLVEVAAHFGFEFRTLMSYRSGYLRIPPSVKVKGKSKRQFSRADVAKFLIARRLFGMSFGAQSVQTFLDFLDEISALDTVFGVEQYLAPQHSLASTAPEIEQELRERIRRTEERMWESEQRLAVLRQEMLNAIWIIAVCPAGPRKGDTFVVSSKAEAKTPFQELCKMLIGGRWQFTLLTLGSVVTEMEERLHAVAACREYKPASAGDQVRRALAEYGKKYGLAKIA